MLLGTGSSLLEDVLGLGDVASVDGSAVGVSPAAAAARSRSGGVVSVALAGAAGFGTARLGGEITGAIAPGRVAATVGRSFGVTVLMGCAGTAAVALAGSAFGGAALACSAAGADFAASGSGVGVAGSSAFVTVVVDDGGGTCFASGDEKKKNVPAVAIATRKSETPAKAIPLDGGGGVQPRRASSWLLIGRSDGFVGANQRASKDAELGARVLDGEVDVDSTSRRDASSTPARLP